MTFKQLVIEISNAHLDKKAIDHIVIGPNERTDFDEAAVYGRTGIALNTNTMEYQLCRERTIMGQETEIVYKE